MLNAIKSLPDTTGKTPYLIIYRHSNLLLLLHYFKLFLSLGLPDVIAHGRIQDYAFFAAPLYGKTLKELLIRNGNSVHPFPIGIVAHIGI